MPALQFPCTIFKTQKQMDDYHASDMRCGDLSAIELKARFSLRDVSTKVNPYTLTKIVIPGVMQPPILDSRTAGEKVTRRECTDILFDEFRRLSRPYAISGPYKELIVEMITHMQKRNGAPFRHPLLDEALREQILTDTSTENSTRLRLANALKDNIDWSNQYYPLVNNDELITAIKRGRLPKFYRFQDNFNGMGITVHDIWATHITIKSLDVNNDRFRAVVHYKTQDHFGLDDEDISKPKFNKFRFFRIWFVLQRYSELGFKPFMTNMEATIEITGSRK